jgi:hypothetical protein
MSRTKTVQELQADYEAVKKELSSLASEQVELQNKLVSLNLLYQVKQHGVARAYTTWFTVGGQ